MIVDPRIELLAVVLFLAGYGQRFPLLTSCDIRYKAEIEATFQPFRNHPAVTLFDQMSNRFHADAPPAAMLHLSDPPALHIQVPFTNYLIERAGGADQLGQFIAALREFAQTSQYMDFYLAHSRFYEAILHEAAAQLSTVDVVAVLENYFGMEQRSYNLILAPLFNQAGYGPRIRAEDDLYDLYCITGSSGMDAQNRPTFGRLENVRSLMWHEFSHSFVNPIVEHYLHEVNQYQALYSLIEKQMKEYGYSNWEITVKEHIVRAAVVRMKARELGEMEGQASLDQELEWGFAYTDLLVERLKQYEQQRNLYPTFGPFFSELIKVFAEAKAVQ